MSNKETSKVHKFLFITNTTMDSIDILERRIASLELKVLPLQNISENNSNTSVADMLLQINTLISSALSCREVVTAILNRMSELNDYLDPNFFDDTLTTNVKKQFVLALYPEIKKYGESLQKLKGLIPVIDSEAVNNIPSLVPKLEKICISNMETEEESVAVSNNIAKSLQQYNDIIYSISSTFVQLEEVISQLELEMKPKIVT